VKASCTWYVAEALEQIRQCLGTFRQHLLLELILRCIHYSVVLPKPGGHGYSSYSGLPSLIADYAVNQTWVRGCMLRAKAS
jgi:hypothetical protein